MAIRVTTWNVNGLRAALDKGFEKHVRKLGPDVLMLQEVRALADQLPSKWARPRRWSVAWHPAERMGYAGVATFSRSPQTWIGVGLDEPDPEGRVLRTRVGDLHLVNVYLPSGSASAEAQARKEAWMARFAPWAAALAGTPEPVILAGDLNIAHTENDIHNPTGNKRNSGFLPHEREWFGALLASGWIDLVRVQVGPIKGPYSFWSSRGQARALDRGWRIDYLLGNAAVAGKVVGASTSREAGMEVSDHAPVSVDLDL